MPAPGMAEISMREVAFLGLVPMRMPLVAGEPGMVALLRSMREVDDFHRADIQGFEFIFIGHGKTSVSSRLLDIVWPAPQPRQSFFRMPISAPSWKVVSPGDNSRRQIRFHQPFAPPWFNARAIPRNATR